MRHPPNGVGRVYWATRKELDSTFRRRHRRTDGRLILLLTQLIALLTASTVVSADAILRLPQLWRASSTAVAVTGGPRLPGLDEHPAAQEAPEDNSTGLSPPASGSASRSSSNEAAPPEYARILRTNDYAESWRQAGPGLDRLGMILRSHQIDVGPGGRLIGQIVSLDPKTGADHPLADLRIRLLHRGTLLATGRTDQRGVFEVDGLKTGTYSLIAAGDESLLAYALHVREKPVPEDEAELAAAAPEPAIGIRLHSAAITGADVAAALSQIATLQTEDVVEVSRVEPPVQRIPEPVRPLQQIGAAGTPLLMHRVQLQDDGRLIGRVRYLHPESGRHLLPSTTRVMLFQGGEMIADGWTDHRGCFDVIGVRAGTYSLVAVTVSDEVGGNVIERNADPTQPVGLFDDRPRRPGYAAFAVEVVPPGTLRRTDQPRPPPADSKAADELLELDFALIDAFDMVAYTSVRASMLESRNSSFWGNRSLVRGRSPRVAPRGAAASPPPPVPSPPGGGPPGGLIGTPFLPPVIHDTTTMSPAML